MDLVIEQVSNRRAADRWHQIAEACAKIDYDELPADPVCELYERLETPRTDKRCEFWLGSVEGTPVVLGELSLPLLDNVANAVVNVATRPSFRRRGYGTQMLDHVMARAQAHNRSRLIGETSEPLPVNKVTADAATTSPGVAFATAVGARAVTSEVRRRLRVAEIDHDQLSRLRDDATAAAAEYSLIQWDGPAPAELLDDLVVLQSRMSIDAPREELEWEPEQWSAERYRETEKSTFRSGQLCISTAARHDPSGELVALTEIGTARSQPDIAYQWLTIVLPDHRGHRLGMRVKLANLELMRSSRPRVTTVNTWNAAVNSHMVSINEAMGFRAVERWREWQLELTAP